MTNSVRRSSSDSAEFPLRSLFQPIRYNFLAESFTLMLTIRTNDNRNASQFTVAIIGGGFSGTTLAAQLMRRSGGNVSVVLIERGARLGRGVAYGTQCEEHFAAEQSVLCSPVCSGIIAKYGHYSRILSPSEWSFSAAETAWRRGRDSNPRYRSETCKLRCLRKLHRINQFINSLRTGCSPVDTPNSVVSRSFREAKRWRLCG
jgi:hypothetical protein